MGARRETKQVTVGLAAMHHRGVGVTVSVTSLSLEGIFQQVLHKISCIKQVSGKSNYINDQHFKSVVST